MAIRSRLAGGPHVEIGGKTVVHPKPHRLAEAANHDSDGNHHGNGGGERGDKDGGAAKRGGKTLRRQESFHAENFSKPVRQTEENHIGESRNRQRGRDDEQDSCDVAENGLSFYRRNVGGHRCRTSEDKRKPQIARFAHSRNILAPAARHGLDGRDERGFAGRRVCGKNCHADANKEHERNGPRGQFDRSGTAADVKRLDGGAHEFHRSSGHDSANGETKRASGQSEKSCLAQEGQKYRATACAQSARNSSFRTAAHDRNRYRVVDKKCADNQRNVTEQLQIPAKGGEHSPIFVRSRSLQANFHAGRQGRAQTLLPLFETWGFWNFQEDAVDTAEPMQRALCCGEIHEDGGFIALRVRIDAANSVFADLIVDQQAKVVAGFFS